MKKLTPEEAEICDLVVSMLRNTSNQPVLHRGDGSTSYTWHFTNLGVQGRVSISWNEYSVSSGSRPYIHITVNGYSITIGHETWHCEHEELYMLLDTKVEACKAESLRQIELAHQIKLMETLTLTKAIAKAYKVNVKEESEDTSGRKITIPA